MSGTPTIVTPRTIRTIRMVAPPVASAQVDEEVPTQHNLTPPFAKPVSPAKTVSSEGSPRVPVEVVEELKIEEDIYSMLFVAKLWSPAFFYALGVFLVQIIIMILIVVDLKKDAEDGNKYKIPIDVGFQVAMAQFISLLIAALSQDDVYMSLFALLLVFDITWEGGDEQRNKWIMANVFRLFEGVFVIVVSFLFIIQSDNVLDIFMNFAAVEFISLLDNAAFFLASLGYASSLIQDVTKETKRVSLQYRPKDEKKWLTWVSMAVLVVPIICGWSFVRYKQQNGLYLESTAASSFSVLFGEEVYNIPSFDLFEFDSDRDREAFFGDGQGVPPALHYAYFSGSYKIECCRAQGQRPVYYERSAEACKTDNTCGLFYYCDHADVQAWVFTIKALGDATKERKNGKCKWGWLAKSPKTKAFKLEDVPMTGWHIWTGVVTETSSLSISSNECTRDSDCSLNGECRSDGTCLCNAGWVGEKCDVEGDFCPLLDWVNLGYKSQDYFEFGPYWLLKGQDDKAIEAYNRPIYYYGGTEKNVDFLDCDTAFELYIFTGRRWYDTYWCPEALARFLPDKKVPQNFAALKDLRFERSFHAYWDNVLGENTKWFSEPTDSVTGLGVPLLEVRTSRALGNYGPFGASFPKQATFQCLDIDCSENANVCGRHGRCVGFDVTGFCDRHNVKCTEDTDALAEAFEEYHECQCDSGYGGHYCEFNPIGPYVLEEWATYYLSIYSEGEYEKSNYYWTFWYPTGYVPDKLEGEREL